MSPKVVKIGQFQFEGTKSRFLACIALLKLSVLIPYIQPGTRTVELNVFGAKIKITSPNPFK